MKPRKKVTLADLSAELGFSIQTISKALRGLPGMSEETRSLIVRTATLRGYLSALQARERARQGITPYPAYRFRFVLVQSLESMNYNRLLMEGLSERFSQYEHQLECYVLNEELSESDFDDWAEKHNLLQSDGLLIAPRLVSSKTEERLSALPVPKVLINYPRPLMRVDSVVWDVYDAVCQAVDLLARNGHRRILYVGDIAQQPGYIQRWQAYQYMMSRIGELPKHITKFDLKRAYDQYRPTAILVGIDEDCLDVINTLNDLGVRIPEDCSLVALLNEPLKSHPHISRPVLMIRETGYQAADRMLWRIAHPNQPFEHTRIIGSLYEGETVAPPGIC